MKDKVTKASRVIAGVQLSGIRLIGVNARSSIRSPEEVEQVQINFTPSAHLSGRLEAGHFFVSASIRFEIRHGRTLNPVVDISADYELEYAVPPDSHYSNEELMAFAQINAVHNVWPYWRELIQSTLVRMNLPPVLLPVFRLSDYRKAVTQKNAGAAAE